VTEEVVELERDARGRRSFVREVAKAHAQRTVPSVLMNVDDAVIKTGLCLLRFFHGIEVTNSADAGAGTSKSA